MKYRRYGAFRLSDYWASWIGIASLLIFAISSFVLRLSWWITVFSSGYAVLWTWMIISPSRERFYLSSQEITVIKRGKKQCIHFPSDVCLIISYADIRPPFAMRTASGNETHILKGRYAVSILQRMPLNDALDRLHKGYLRRYTTSTIRACFEEFRYIYCFVCDNELLDLILHDKNCLLIVPESLASQVSTNHPNVTVHIDAGY